MAYQNNNNRITPKTAGKYKLTPITNIVNKEVIYKPELNTAENTANLAQSLSAFGKGIIDFDQSGIMQKQAQEQAIELIYKEEAEGKNRHDWIKAQQKVQGLQRFNPYIKDSYKDLSAQDYYQKAIFELTSDSNYYKKSQQEISEFIQNKKEAFNSLLKESGIEPRISAKYLESFHDKCNTFYGEYLNKNATYTYNLTLAKTNAEAAKALRTSFYEVPKEQQGIVMSNVINNIIKNHPDIPKDDLVNNVLVPMSVRVISEHTGSIEQAEFINTLKNVKIGNSLLSEIYPDIELKLRDSFKNAALQKMQEEELEWKISKRDLEKRTEEAESEFFKTIFNNPDVDLVETAKQIVSQYNIEGNYNNFLNTITSYKTQIASLDKVDSDIETLKLFDTQLGLEQLDRNMLTQAYASGKLSRNDYYSILDRDLKREAKVNSEAQKLENAGYEAVFNEAKSYMNNLDTKKILRSIKTGDNNTSTAYADYAQIVANVNSDVKTGTITKAEGQKRLKELQEYYNKVYIQKPKKPQFNPANLISKMWRNTNLAPLKESQYNEKTATKAFKELGILVQPFNPKITSGIKDNRTVKLKDGTVKTSSHQAYDLRASVGTLVRMPRHSSGRILFKGTNNSMGNYILVQFDKTGDYMLMLHLQYVPNWKIGQHIPANAKLAQTGDTGAVEAAHLDVSFYKEDGTRRLSVEDFTNRLTSKKK